MTTTPDPCDECPAPATIMIAGVGYCVEHAFQQIGAKAPPPRTRRVRRPKAKRPSHPSETDL